MIRILNEIKMRIVRCMMNTIARKGLLNVDSKKNLKDMTKDMTKDITKDIIKDMK